MTNKEIIRQKLRVKSVTIGTSRTAAFSSGEYHMNEDSDYLAEQHMRYIVAIILIGDGSGSRIVDIEKYEEDGSYTMKFDDVPIAPADVRQLPPNGYSIEDPILTLEGGTNLYLKADAGSPKATIIYWDK